MPLKTLQVPKQGHTYTEMYQRFGDPNAPNFEARNIVSTAHTIAGGHVITLRCHRLLVPAFHAVWEDLTAQAALDTIKTYDGCYANRNVRGASNKSIHAWGAAIDLNAKTHPLGIYIEQDARLMAAFRKAGFFWGGNFHKRKDCMHWEWTDGNI